jgi:rhodanese-related sulfurtransferase
MKPGHSQGQPNAVLLDVRTEAEFAEGHIAGAQQLAVENCWIAPTNCRLTSRPQSSSIAAVAGVQPGCRTTGRTRLHHDL